MNGAYSAVLTVMESLPAGLLERDATRLHEVLSGPTLIHLPGRRKPALFVSVLLHGNEDAGWVAARTILQQYRNKPLPRALSLFIGNVEAARYHQRFLEHQPDFNRIWEDTPGMISRPERAMARNVVEAMRHRGVFACLDVHTNTGINPHYGCVRRLDHRFFHLAILFSRTVVYFKKPDGVLVAPFAALCPAVTVECGKAGTVGGAEHAQRYIEACLHLSELPAHPVPAHDIDLFHTVAILKVPDTVTFGFGDEDCDICFTEDLDHMNFRELSVGTCLGRIRDGSHARVEVWDEIGRDLGERYLRIDRGRIVTAVPVMPSMLTINKRAVRQDCLGYLMENRRELFDQAAATTGQPAAKPL